MSEPPTNAFSAKPSHPWWFPGSFSNMWRSISKTSSAVAWGAPEGVNPQNSTPNAVSYPTLVGVSASSIPEKVTLDTITDDDFVIMVLGPSGAGKTTLINSFAGGQDTGLKVGHNLTDGTSDISCVRLPNIHIPRGKKHVVLVDTPGYDHYRRPDSASLEIIAGWLEKSYRKGRLLSGAIYLERITDVRLTTGSTRSFDVMREAYGTSGHKHLALVTTHWNDHVNGDEETLARLKKREKYLISRPWASFLKKPDTAHICRFNTSTPDSAQADARRIVEELINAQTPGNGLKLHIQVEMVDKGISLPRTKAGKVVFDAKGTVDFYLRRVWGSGGPGAKD